MRVTQRRYANVPVLPNLHPDESLCKSILEIVRSMAWRVPGVELLTIQFWRDSLSSPPAPGLLRNLFESLPRLTRLRLVTIDNENHWTVRPKFAVEVHWEDLERYKHRAVENWKKAFEEELCHPVDVARLWPVWWD